MEEFADIMTPMRLDETGVVGLLSEVYECRTMMTI
jgi:hypothetical protein